MLTFHRCINYGSYWQARCLVEGLRARGCDAVLLDHDSRKINRAELRCALQPLLPVRTRASELAEYAEKTRRFMRAVAALPRSARFDLANPVGMENFDLVIVGSDEVWNLQHPWYGGCVAFFGTGLRAKRLVSYAASFGSYDAVAGLTPMWAEKLHRFERISIRDENSRRLVRNALGQDPRLVLDPCLQFPPAVQGNDDTGVDQPYIAVYGHSFPGWFADSVVRAGKARGYRLLSIGYRNDWTDEQCISAGPDDFARLMAGAAAVATNFFHGCVFALLNDRPLVCAPSGYRRNKMRDLTSLLGCERHIVREDSAAPEYAKLLGLRPEITTKLTALRHESNTYLTEALGQS